MKTKAALLGIEVRSFAELNHDIRMSDCVSNVAALEKNAARFGCCK